MRVWSYKRKLRGLLFLNNLFGEKTMTDNNLLSRISIDPAICFGNPCIRGHRIWVSTILDLLASGATFEEILEDYGGIDRLDILACIAYGAEMSRGYFSESPLAKNREVAAA